MLEGLSAYKEPREGVNSSQYYSKAESESKEGQARVWVLPRTRSFQEWIARKVGATWCQWSSQVTKVFSLVDQEACCKGQTFREFFRVLSASSGDVDDACWVMGMIIFSHDSCNFILMMSRALMSHAGFFGQGCKAARGGGPWGLLPKYDPCIAFSPTAIGIRTKPLFMPHHCILLTLNV